MLFAYCEHQKWDLEVNLLQWLRGILYFSIKKQHKGSLKIAELKVGIKEEDTVLKIPLEYFYVFHKYQIIFF